MNVETARTLIPAEALSIENDLDRALIAFFTGHARRPDGNGVGYAPAWDSLPALVRRGLVQSKTREFGATPLVWLTEEGHGVVSDIIAEDAFDAHVAAIRA